MSSFKYKTQTDLVTDFEKYTEMCEDLRENFSKRFHDLNGQETQMDFKADRFLKKIFSANTKKSQNMPNSDFSSQIALNKAESLQFGIIKMPIWQHLVQNKGPGAQQFPTKKEAYDLTIFCVYVYLSVLFANYDITNEWPTS